MRQNITVTTTIKSPVKKVWEIWTKPDHIIKWNNASDDWHTPHAENDLQVGGEFKSVMAAKDGSMSFDFVGTYTAVETYKYIAYELTDGRKVNISFKEEGDITHVTETFESEDINPVEIQKSGWQAILDNFKKYTENYK